MELKSAMRRCRTLRNVSQHQAAQAAGVSETMYQFYEYGRSEPTAHILVSLADFYDVSIDYLVGRSDDPTRH